MIYHAELAVDCHCSLGEGPIWDEKTEEVIWIDYNNGTMHTYSPENRKHRIFRLPVKVACFARCTGGGLIIAGEHGIARYRLENGEMAAICNPEEDLPHTRFNDGKCDPSGRFIAGTLSERNEPDGALYVIYSDGSYLKLEDHISCSNGITWSKDEKTMYYIDSLAQQVVAYDFDMQTGIIRNKREVIPYQGSGILPDGMTSDEEGMIWVAEWGGWKVSRWNAVTGQCLDMVKVPAKHVTSCVFGGKDLDELYITTASCDLSDAELASQPHAGGLFRVKTGVRGRPTYLFNEGEVRAE